SVHLGGGRNVVAQVVIFCARRAPATYPAAAEMHATSTSRSPPRLASVSARSARKDTSATSPAKARPAPSHQVRLGARRSTAAAMSPVKSGDTASTSAAWEAEV